MEPGLWIAAEHEKQYEEAFSGIQVPEGTLSEGCCDAAEHTRPRGSARGIWPLSKWRRS